MIQKILSYISKHKMVSALVVIILVGGGWYAFAAYSKPAAATQYVTEPASQGTLVVSVSGTGQVASATQIDVKPQVSSTVIKVIAKNGATVKAGDPLVQLDDTTAAKAVRDAKTNLDSAELSYKKLTEPVDPVTLLQDENALAQAQANLDKLQVSQTSTTATDQEQQQTANDNLTKGYEDAYNEIANTFVDLPGIMSGLDDTLHGQTLGKDEKSIGPGYTNEAVLINTSLYDDRATLQPFVDRADQDYQTANSSYTDNFNSYKIISRTSDHSAVDSLLSQTITTVKAAADAAKSETNLLDEWVSLRTARSATDYTGAANAVTTYRNSLDTYTSQVNGHLSNLIGDKAAITSSENSLADATRSIGQTNSNNPLDLASAEQAVQEATINLERLKTGPDPLDVQTSQLSVVQRQNALSDAEEQLSYYTVRTPIDGTVTGIILNPSDPAGSGTTVATIVSPNQVANISLNEVDVAKVQVGQKATMTFDAIDGLTMTGKVVQIDTIGTVSQGVVSYNVEIAFDSQNDQIKPGMSVSASVITQVDPDVLLVPSAAVKTQGQLSYVQTLVNGQPVRHTVQVVASNDSQSEVTGDIHDGDMVVTQTITASAATTTPAAATGGGLGGLRVFGGGGGFGGGGAGAGAVRRTGN